VQLYRLESPVVAGGDVVDLRDPNGRISSFFIWDRGDDTWLRYSVPAADAQSRIRLQDVFEADYLQAAIGVPLFSERARGALSDALRDELRFYECTVRCQGREVPFFLGKVLAQVGLVDEARSGFRTLSGGEQVLTQAVYRTSIADDFAIARDERFRERLVVSQRFVDLCHAAGLRVRFAGPV
jgi:hypothetical protein